MAGVTLKQTVGRGAGGWGIILRIWGRDERERRRTWAERRGNRDRTRLQCDLISPLQQMIQYFDMVPVTASFKWLVLFLLQPQPIAHMNGEQKIRVVTLIYLGLISSLPTVFQSHVLLFWWRFSHFNQRSSQFRGLSLVCPPRLVKCQYFHFFHFPLFSLT